MNKIKVEIEFYCNNKIYNQILDIDKIYIFNSINCEFQIHDFPSYAYNYTDELKNTLNNDFLNNIIQFIKYNKIYSKYAINENKFDIICYILHKLNFYTKDKKYYLNCNFIEDNKDFLIGHNLNQFILLSSINYNFKSNKKLYNGNINNIVINRRIPEINNDPNSNYHTDNLRFSQIITIILQHIFYQEYLKENNQELITFKQLINYNKYLQQQINQLKIEIENLKQINKKEQINTKINQLNDRKQIINNLNIKEKNDKNKSLNNNQYNKLIIIILLMIMITIYNIYFCYKLFF